MTATGRITRTWAGCATVLVAAWVLAWTSGCATAPREPGNLDLHKRQLRAYVDGGNYRREIDAVAGQAQRWIEERAARGGTRLTVIFDLDETLLENLAHMKENDFGYRPTAWTQWVEEGRAPAIDPAREGYRTARRLGGEVVFITGRRERDRPGTEKNLRAIGCTDYAELICKPDDDRGTSGAYKTRERERLTRAGRTLIANLGDQDSDLAGGFAERTFKLPNPFYLSE